MHKSTFIGGAVLVGAVLFLSTIYIIHNSDHLEKRTTSVSSEEEIVDLMILQKHRVAASIFKSLNK